MAVRLAAAVVLAIACSSCALIGGKRDAKSGDESGEASGDVTIEYVPIAIAWVKRHAGASPNDIAAWAKTPAAEAALPQTQIRHLLVEVPDDAPPKTVVAAKKRAAALAARIKNGESIDDLAMEESDDDATKERGGALGSDPAKLAEPLRSAVKSLPPDGNPTIVRSAVGFHVIARDAVDPIALAKAFKKWRAPELARKLADDMLAQMQSSKESLDSIEKKVVADVLGDRANQDPKRRGPVTLPANRAGDADLPPDAKEALASFARTAHPGDVVDSPLGSGPVLVVARAVSAK